MTQQKRVAVYVTATVLQWYGWPMLSVAAVETFFSAITFALTLLLVFKTNSSYARWWEARAKVGMLTSTAHDLARAVSSLHGLMGCVGR
jgi:predicted membrane chloride channel (bestrophin family)